MQDLNCTIALETPRGLCKFAEQQRRGDHIQAKNME
jgi:hypothetical protein